MLLGDRCLVWDAIGEGTRPYESRTGCGKANESFCGMARPAEIDFQKNDPSIFSYFRRGFWGGVFLR